MTLRPFSSDLQRLYRDAMRTPGSPEVIDDGVPVVAVSVINADGKREASVISGAQIGAGTTTLGTVPAGKVWRIMTAQMSGGADFASVEGECSVQLNSVKVLVIRSNGSATQVTNATGLATWGYYNCPVGRAGQTVTLVVPASLRASASVSYVEEDAV